MICHDFKITTRTGAGGRIEWVILSNAGVVRATAGRSWIRAPGGIRHSTLGD